MDNEQKKIESRKQRVKLWLKNPYNLGILLIVLASFILRIYLNSKAVVG